MKTNRSQMRNEKLYESNFDWSLTGPTQKESGVTAAVSNISINEIIRGELSAVEACSKLEDQFKEMNEGDCLKELVSDHKKAVRFWKKEAVTGGAYPEGDSGLWGSLVSAYIGLSKLFSERLALQALKEGENYGLSYYKRMLNRDELTEFQKAAINRTFIPIYYTLL